MAVHTLIEDEPGGIPSYAGASAGFAAPGPIAGDASLSLGGGEGHPTHFWVAGVMLVALVGLLVLHLTGFRFSTDVGVTRG